MCRRHTSTLNLSLSDRDLETRELTTLYDGMTNDEVKYMFTSSFIVLFCKRKMVIDDSVERERG